MFKKYNSIENSYRTEFLDRIKGHQFWNESYVVQEKVHGANLSFYSSDGINFTAAKRNESLAVDDKFYNHQLILKQHLDKFQSMVTTIKRDFQNISQVAIFGEIIGGNYPHKELKENMKAIKVQKGIFYSPNNEFYAFDIQINQETYLDVDYVNALFETHEMLHAKTLFQGSIEDCLEHSNIFQTTIPKILGLPEINPNYCEGVIIRPKITRLFNNGTRVILKNKNDKWTENSKYTKSIKKELPLTEIVKELQQAINSYVTENRLNNVLSKIGEVCQVDFGKIIAAFNRDVIEDFSKDYKKNFSTLKKQDQKLITKSIVKNSSKMIKEFLNNKN